MYLFFSEFIDPAAQDLVNLSAEAFSQAQDDLLNPSRYSFSSAQVRKIVIMINHVSRLFLVLERNI